MGHRAGGMVLTMAKSQAAFDYYGRGKVGWSALEMHPHNVGHDKAVFMRRPSTVFPVWDLSHIGHSATLIRTLVYVSGSRRHI